MRKGKLVKLVSEKGNAVFCSEPFLLFLRIMIKQFGLKAIQNGSEVFQNPKSGLKTLVFKLVIVLGLFCVGSRVSAKIKLPVIFSDGMVLQRETENKIRGWASVGEEIELLFNKETYHALTNERGEWEIVLPLQKAGGPYEMVFRGENEIKISNILFGDVWFCSGQSNMVLTMERVKEKYPGEIQNASFPEIRNFTVPVKNALNGAQEDLPGGLWMETNPVNVLSFSAVAYFFARDIYSRVKVPVGIINASVGGTPIEAWISEEGFQNFSDIKKIINKNKDTAYVAAQLKAAKPATTYELKDKGLLEQPRWFEDTYVPKGWYTINIPGYWEDQGVRNLNGVVWYRKEIDLPKSMTGVPAKLFMGRIVDADEVYINGEKVGNITYQYPPRRYNIKEGLLKTGKNTIVIRVGNYAGKGGFVPDKPYYLTANNQDIDLKGTWEYKVGEVFEPKGESPPAFVVQDQPTALYNAMVAPVIQQKVKGFLWYQGETNSWNPKPYFDYLYALIQDWRSKWQNDDLPFLYVQLANFMEVDYLPVESKWAELRFAQFRALSVPNTAMTVTIDLGEWNDIHPLNKKDVGERLAKAALKLAYNKNIVYSGPIYSSSKIDGNKIVLSFDHIGSGLISNDGEPLRRFEIAGSDGIFRWATAKIIGAKIEVWNENIAHPVKVRYAWSDNPRDANLYNKEGLPASPFQTEGK